MRLTLLLSLGLCAALCAGCPAYIISGVGGSRGHDVVESRPDHPDARLECAGKPCDSVRVVREYDQAKRGNVFLTLFGLELAGTGLSIYGAEKISRDLRADRIDPSKDNRRGYFIAAAVVLGGFALADFIAGLTGAAGKEFDKTPRDKFLDGGSVQVTWRRTPYSINLNDVLADDRNTVLPVFSVQKSMEAHGVRVGAREYKVKPNTSVAVLNFKYTSAGLTPEQGAGVTDQARISFDRARPGLNIMTTENVTALMQANNVDPEKCEGLCNVEIGRLVNADLVVSGTITRIEGVYKLSVKMEDTHDGTTLSGDSVTAATLRELDNAIPGLMKSIVGPLL